LARREELGLEALYLDVTDHKSIAEAIDKITSKQQRLDVLVNNEGYASVGPFEELSIQEFKEQFETNLLVSSELHNQYYQ
jgi:NAD(P)-dependent dehydrogenase (short-subunit alcohol dehydrogenase family)